MRRAYLLLVADPLAGALSHQVDLLGHAADALADRLETTAATLRWLAGVTRATP